ncbi:NADPH-dependent 7-cyano-7-deazaguanine reductase QueF [Acidovorax cavernicola]|uniref:NADPH-dependent 7-cyano-7-deazaguanine reductase n=1 Tax=Acidovorax cavernicola TaxID=1675792 RepID=A0A9X8D2S0_9BURK|nr:NADPH-dependent 7-cyano-7-deazaguanine reductase QueF [Acidovorax cavernicola]RIX77331.1 NADPH-dependent 7-cyano-7-deazaguanine reductase QueF [Acidovorax cavernicola]
MSHDPTKPITANTPEQSQLGRASAYADKYDPSQLFPIARATQREAMGIQAGALPFFGADLWTAFELSWLNPRGKPQVAIAHFTIPCETPNIIESKSFKLYLNSFNNTVFASADEVRERLRTDLSEAAWRGSAQPATIGVKLLAPEMFDREPVHELDGLDLDRLDIECTRYQPAPELLSSDATQAPVTETLTSRLLKSNCLVTGQPDWGSVQIRYSGPPIDQAGLLAYIVSFRNHNEFHEPCAERMFTDIWRQCQPTKLAVYARYTRRGGLDINPFRTSWPQALPVNARMARQ